MKSFPTFRIYLCLLILPFTLLIACKDEVKRTRTYKTQIATFKSLTSVRAQGLTVQAPVQLSAPGKIYIYGNYLFINEVNKGIHIVDNSNPSAPRFINFINIPGNADLAVFNKVLYADHYIDLLAFDISNPANVIPIKRVEDVFDNWPVNEDKELIVYKDTVITEEIGGPNERHYNYDSGGGFSLNNGGVNSAVGGSQAGNSYGTGGSTARFTLMNSHLYTVSNTSLQLFNVANAKDPKYINKIQLGWGIETIFPYQNKLFIGTTTGMHIYDASIPSAPVKLSTYAHLTSCDPVVVDDKYAYVTLRSGNFCQQGVNVLEVLNIEDLSNPKLTKSYPMQNPHGLSISNSNLYICEGQYGFKAFNSSNVLTIAEHQLAHIKGIDAQDVIAGPKSLIVTGKKGIYQYDYSNPSEIKLLSHLTLSPEL